MTVPANTHAIVITAHNVTLDLAGFLVQGAVFCTGFGAAYTCQAGEGIGVLANARMFTTVRNGTIRGFYMGVRVGAHARVEDLQVGMSNYVGISTEDFSLVARNVVSGAGYGISAHRGIVRDNVVHNAQRNGIVGFEALIVGNRVSLAGNSGIFAGNVNGKGAVAHNVVKDAVQPNNNQSISEAVSLGDGQSNLCSEAKC